ncbi:hypothetical protein Amet_1210 [Alkaliphilus metalliredigens QYMF]|uniref:DUF6199 domain-containing protein n=1 Tax=Alkaliphilus metalliredigens (strain QYMF) TaxID=293826 RepID=A6TMK0_ALKMQ|nr:hypothetical protein [Alkaliphilus metalliredigens]ABR47418.1 hypothetical protein Amet_1210 [Alkaliphilus metalliredigens QYMF]
MNIFIFIKIIATLFFGINIVHPSFMWYLAESQGRQYPEPTPKEKRMIRIVSVISLVFVWMVLPQ